MWTPNSFKDYHPLCKAFFKRELCKELAIDIAAELKHQHNAYDQYEPIFAQDENLSTDLLECLSFVVAQLGLSYEVFLNELDF